jgi:cupin 2 domain-containing protein
VANLFAGVPPSLPAELTEVLADRGHVRIERIVSRGHRSPDDFWYDQAEHEWVVVLAGRARVAFDDERDPVTLGPGDFLDIAAHQRHRVEWTDPNADTIWLAVFVSDVPPG